MSKLIIIWLRGILLPYRIFELIKMKFNPLIYRFSLSNKIIIKELISTSELSNLSLITDLKNYENI